MNSKANIIKIKETQLEIAENDFPNWMNWKDANNACESLGPDWRLPTSDELSAIYEILFLENQGNFKKETYWCKDYIEDDEGFGKIYACVDFFDGLVFSNP
ncbi:MAG: hypothetical protein ACK5AY_01090, partial [Bacteroidota bacterium]